MTRTVAWRSRAIGRTGALAGIVAAIASGAATLAGWWPFHSLFLAYGLDAFVIGAILRGPRNVLVGPGLGVISIGIEMAFASDVPRFRLALTACLLGVPILVGHAMGLAMVRRAQITLLHRDLMPFWLRLLGALTASFVVGRTDMAPVGIRIAILSLVFSDVLSNLMPLVRPAPLQGSALVEPPAPNSS